MKILSYHLFHLSYPNEDFISYTDCEFYLYTKDGSMKDAFLKDGTKVKVLNEEIIEPSIIVKSINDYKSLVDKYSIGYKLNTPILGVKKISFDTNKVKDNFFRVFQPNFGLISGYYVTEKLKIMIEETGFTGLDFRSLEEIFSETELNYI